MVGERRWVEEKRSVARAKERRGREGGMGVEIDDEGKLVVDLEEEVERPEARRVAEEDLLQQDDEPSFIAIAAWAWARQAMAETKARTKRAWNEVRTSRRRWSATRTEKKREEEEEEKTQPLLSLDKIS